MALALDVQGLAAVAALAEARKVEKAAAQAAKDAADAVRELLGDEREGTVAGVVVVKIKEVVRHDIDGKRLKDDDPDLAARYDKVVRYDKIELA